MLRTLLCSLLACAVIATGGCDAGSAGEAAAEGKLVLVASVPPHAWLIEQIAGDDAEVISLIGPGDSPHTYQPGDKQMVRISQADAYFRTGVSFERGAWFDAITDMQGGPQIVDLRQGITLLQMAAHGHPAEAPDAAAPNDDEHDDHAGHDHHGHDTHGHQDESAEMDGTDPHIWLAPYHLVTQAKTITRTLKQIDPQHAAEYDARNAALRTEIEQTHAEIFAMFRSAWQPRMYVFHPAWGYFAAAYGIKQMPIEIEGKQPDDKQLRDFREQARADGVTTIFVQPQVAGKAAEAIASSIGAKVETIDPLARDVLANLKLVAGKVRSAQPMRDKLKRQADPETGEPHHNEDAEPESKGDQE